MPMTQDRDQIILAERSSSSPSLHQVREQSKAIWVRDLRGLYEHAKERFADVKWIDSSNSVLEGIGEAEYLQDGSIGAEAVDELLQLEPSGEDSCDNASQAVFAHKAIVYARASKAFKDRFFPVLLAGGFSSPNLTSVATQSSLSSASVPNLFRHSLGTEPSTSHNRSSLRRTSSQERFVPFSQSTSELGFVNSDANGRHTPYAYDKSSLYTRPPTAASSQPADGRIPNRFEIDQDSRLTLSHHGMPEMLKQALEWLYTAEGPFQEMNTKALGFPSSEAVLAAVNPDSRIEDSLQETGLISAKGVDGQNSVHGKKLSINRIRLAQVS